jgi:hypothetical protein
MKKGTRNNNEAAFEAELYNSLKFYGYLFPENVEEVEAFEQLQDQNIGETPSLHNIISTDTDTLLSNSVDLEIGLAAYSSPEHEFPKFPDEMPDDQENNDQQ